MCWPAPVSAYTYGKNRNLDVKNGLIMMFTVLGFTLVGSYLASLLPSATMGGFSTVMTLLLGIKFIVKPVMTTKEAMASVSAGKPGGTVRAVRDPDWPDLRVCRGRGRHDDAVDSNLGAGL